jgi:hypothetical protein
MNIVREKIKEKVQILEFGTCWKHIFHLLDKVVR